MNVYQKIIDELNVLDIGKGFFAVHPFKKRGGYQKDFMYKKGSLYYLLCLTPHMEKTPSFCLKDRKNFFFCYGCHDSGGPLRLLSYLTENPLNYLECERGFNIRNEEFSLALREAIVREKNRFDLSEEHYRAYCAVFH